ncbi:MAG TPA: AarF/UbiB family protein [Actinophytocola sp.]|uniref:ABC1 kinase family protein n=1 Tax=Actinophytocola sp. TaxID=1872138 RepID=UPI002E05D46C|nr:AarF/UbiB family protein [Actinophytocola sp.]
MADNDGVKARPLDVPLPYAVVILTGRAAKTGWVMAGTGVRLAVAWVATRPRGRRDRFEGKLINIGMRTIHRLGATFIKFAQLLSTRVDVLPAELCARLAVLHDDVPAISPRRARRLVAKRLGGDLDAIFAEFDAVPVASGSIACVYRATLHDGSVVAVKLRRPGVDKVLGADFTLMRGVARIMAKLPAFRSMPVREMIDQMGGAIAAQLDFTREAVSATALADNLEEMPGVIVPRVRADLTGPAETGAGILALEFIPDLVRRNPAQFTQQARDAVVENALESVFKMLFQDGFVHNDLHPGNLYFRPDGTIVMVDAGFVTKLSEHARWHFADYFYAMATGNEARCSENIISTGIRPKNFDEVGFRREHGELVRKNSGAHTKDFNLLQFAITLFDIQNRYGLYGDPEFVFPLLSMLVLEGAIKEFAPDTNFQKLAIPYVLLGLEKKSEAA